jgi:hypothetical protein
VLTTMGERPGDSNASRVPTVKRKLSAPSRVKAQIANFLEAC